MASRARMRTRREIGSAALSSLSGNELLQRQQSRRKIFGRQARLSKSSVSIEDKDKENRECNEERVGTHSRETKKVINKPLRRKVGKAFKENPGSVSAKPLKRVTFSLPPKKNETKRVTESSIDTTSKLVAGPTISQRRRKSGLSARYDECTERNTEKRKHTGPRPVLLPIVSLRGGRVVYKSAVSWARDTEAQCTKASGRELLMCTLWAPPDRSLLDF